MTLSLVAPGSIAAAGGGGGGGSAGSSANPAYGPLSAQYWKWLLAIPASSNPAIVAPANKRADCGPGQSGPVVFLAGSFGSDAVTRACTVPRGKPLFFPLINIINVKTEPGETAESLWRDLHVKSAWTITSLSLTVNGVKILNDVPPTARYRGCAGPARGCEPRSFAFWLPKDPVFLDPGLHKPTVADGYYALLPPQQPGRLTLTFGGAGTRILDPETGTIEELGQDVTYHLIVK